MCCLRFSRDWIAECGDNLDISWLKDDREDDNGDLPEPTILVQEAMGELKAGASRFCKSTW
jgi:type I restriction enzyme M protein